MDVGHHALGSWIVAAALGATLPLAGCIIDLGPEPLPVSFETDFDCHGSSYALLNGGALKPLTEAQISETGLQMGTRLAGCDMVGIWKNEGSKDFTNLRILVEVVEEGTHTVYTTTIQDTRLLIGSSGTTSDSLPAGFGGVMSLDNELSRPQCADSEGLEYLLCGRDIAYGSYITVKGSFVADQGRSSFSQTYYHFNHALDVEIDLGSHEKVCMDVEVDNTTVAPHFGKCVETSDDEYVRSFTFLAPEGSYEGTIRFWNDDEDWEDRAPISLEVEGFDVSNPQLQGYNLD